MHFPLQGRKKNVLGCFLRDHWRSYNGGGGEAQGAVPAPPPVNRRVKRKK